MPEEPTFTPRVAPESRSSRLTSKLKILRTKFQFQQTEMQFRKASLQGNPYATVTDGLLKSDRPLTKQQPRFRSFRRGKDESPLPKPHLNSRLSQRDRLSKMMDSASKNADRSRPQTSRGIRAQSQSKSQCLDDEQLPGNRPRIPVKEMYRPETRHRSVDLDSIIRVNSRSKVMPAPRKG